jgi:seryl-tRNA synthetase
MHDIRLIRADADGFARAMARRKADVDIDHLLALDAARRDELKRGQELQAERNALSKSVGQLRRAGEPTAELEARSTALADATAALTADAEAKGRALDAILETLPNILDADVPDGADEAGNVQLRQVGHPSLPSFPPKQHFELGEASGLMEFERAGRMAGSRFTLLRGELARLERALGQFMLDLHTREHGYQEVSVPVLVNAASMYGTSQLPKFEEDLFRTTDGRYLIPTAEVPLTNYVSGEIVPEARLPYRFAALSQCFRSEAGSAGRDTRGMLRQHQFAKVELVSITHPDQSDAEHERMTECAEKVLDLLELPYRRLLLCSGDTGFGSARTHDLEVWLPGQGAWREISSCSNMRDFQARRMNARYRGADGKAAGLVHTLNGSGVAVGRALIAVLEVHQQADGSVAVPVALRPYLGGQEQIGLS